VIDYDDHRNLRDKFYLLLFLSFQTRVAPHQLAVPNAVDWIWILRHMWSKVPAECAKADILDTLVCEAGSPLYYMFTNPSGMIGAKTGQYLDLMRVRDEFMKLALNAVGVDCTDANSMNLEEHVAPNAVVCLAHRQSGELMPLNYEKFYAICKNGCPSDVVALQGYTARSRGHSNRNDMESTEFAQLYNEYSLSSVGLPTFRSYTVSKDGGPPIACLNRPANDSMSRIVSSLVRLVESSKKCRVVSMVTEFTVDADSRVWLLRTTQCLTSVDGNGVRTKPAQERKAQRTAQATVVGQALTMATLPDETVPSSLGGTNSRVRAARRRERDQPPDEEEIQKILGESSKVNRRRDMPPGTIASTNSDIRKQATSSAAAQALGSTQLGGCPGDFCGRSYLSLSLRSPFATRQLNVVIKLLFISAFPSRILICFFAYIINVMLYPKNMTLPQTCR
jgi:hypothetical protein